MAMATTSSFTLSSFTVPKPHSLLPHSLHSLSSSLHPTPPSLSVAFPAAKRFQALSSRFVRNVAMSSEVDQEEDDESFGGGRQPRFSADVKLFVGNLPFDCDSAQLAGLFESAGNVEMVEVIYDKMTGRSRGFGFVTMSSVDEAEAAAQQFNGYDFQGRQLRVNAGPPPPKRDEYGSSPRAPRGGGGYESSRGGGGGYESSRGGFGGGGGGDSSHRLHVGNLSWGVDDLSLRDLFSDHGNVVEAKVIFDRESGRSRGFGFVTFNSSDEVNKAIDSLDGADLDGRQIRVTVAEARPPRRQF